MTLNLWTFAQGFLQPWAPTSLVLWRTCNYLTHPWDLIRCCILGEILSTSTGNDPSSLILFVDYFPQHFSLHFVSFFFSFVHYWVNLWVITHLSSHCLEPGSSNHHLIALKWTWAARASALVLEHKVLKTTEINISGINWELLLLVTMRHMTGSAMHLRVGTFFPVHQPEAGLTCK